MTRVIIVTEDTTEERLRELLRPYGRVSIVNISSMDNAKAIEVITKVIMMYNMTSEEIKAMLKTAVNMDTGLLTSIIEWVMMYENGYISSKGQTQAMQPGKAPIINSQDGVK